MTPLTNKSAFGGVGEDYAIEGSDGDNQPLRVLPVAASYDWLPSSELPSAVLELANLYSAFARDLAAGTHAAPTFEDALWLHRLFDAFKTSNERGTRVTLG